MSFVKKYRFYIDIVGIFFFGYFIYFFLDKYLNEGKKSLNMVFVVFAFLMIVVKISDIVEYLQKRKSIGNK